MIFPQKGNVSLLIVISVMLLLQNMVNTSRLQITTAVNNAPISEVINIYTQIKLDMVNKKPYKNSMGEWCLYFRFLLDFALKVPRYNLENKINQFKEKHIVYNYSKVGQDFSNFFINIGYQTAKLVDVSGAYEPDYADWTAPFYYAKRFRNYSVIPILMEMLKSNFKLAEFSSGEQTARTSQGPCLDIQEMFQFILLLISQNAMFDVELNLSKVDTMSTLDMTNDTVDFVSSLLSAIETDDIENAIVGYLFFAEILSTAFPDMNMINYEELDVFKGDTTQEKEISRLNVIKTILLNFASIEEKMKAEYMTSMNPHLKHFLIKGTIMAAVAGIKYSLTGGLDIVVSEEPSVNYWTTYVVEQAANALIDKIVEQVDINNKLANEAEKQLNISQKNILANLIDSITADVPHPFYLKLNKAADDMVNSEMRRVRALLMRRLLI